MRKCKLGDIAEFKNGVNYSKGEQGYSYKCIGVTDFSQEYVMSQFEECAKVELDNEINSDYILEDGDILLVRSNGNKNLIGRSMMVFPKDEKVIYSGFCIRCRIISDSVYPAYVLFILKDALAKGRFAKNRQTNINNINQTVLSDLEILLPDYPLQKKIADILLSFTNKIEQNKLMIEALESMAKTLYDYWFVQFDFPDANGRPYKTSGGKMVWNEELGREIPAGWEVNNLFHIASYVNGLACQKYRPKDGEESLPVIKIREMHEGLRQDTERVSKNIPSENVIDDGNILFSWSATLEIQYWVGGKGGLNQHIFKVIPQESFPKEYVYHQLKEYVVNFVKIAEARKTTMGHITQDHLDLSRITIPPLAILEKFASKVQPIHKQMILCNQENRQLTFLRDFLLPMLMNGQVLILD